MSTQTFISRTVQSGIHNIQKSINYPDVHQLMSRQAKCSLSLLEGMFLAQGSNPGLSHGRRILYELNHKGSPRILVVGSLSLLQQIFSTQEFNQGLEKEVATHSSILAWEIPWMEEPGGLQSAGSQRVGHDLATSLSLLHCRQILYQLSCQGSLHITTEWNISQKKNEVLIWASSMDEP